MIAKSASHSIEECRIKIIDGVKCNENFNFPSNEVDLPNLEDNNVFYNSSTVMHFTVLITASSDSTVIYNIAQRGRI